MKEKRIENLMKLIETVHREGVAIRKHFTIEFRGQQYKNRMFTRKSIFDVFVN
jgi:hypothetical protein